jgi:hypothetical protein
VRRGHGSESNGGKKVLYYKSNYVHNRQSGPTDNLTIANTFPSLIGPLLGLAGWKTMNTNRKLGNSINGSVFSASSVWKLGLPHANGPQYLLGGPIKGQGLRKIPLWTGSRVQLMSGAPGMRAYRKSRQAPGSMAHYPLSLRAVEQITHPPPFLPTPVLDQHSSLSPRLASIAPLRTSRTTVLLPEMPLQHGKYYFHDGNVIFLVSFI